MAIAHVMAAVTAPGIIYFGGYSPENFGDGSTPVGSRGEALVWGLGSKSPRI